MTVSPTARRACLRCRAAKATPPPTCRMARSLQLLLAFLSGILLLLAFLSGISLLQSARLLGCVRMLRSCPPRWPPPLAPPPVLPVASFPDDADAPAGLLTRQTLRGIRRRDRRPQRRAGRRLEPHAARGACLWPCGRAGCCRAVWAVECGCVVWLGHALCLIIVCGVLGHRRPRRHRFTASPAWRQSTSQSTHACNVQCFHCFPCLGGLASFASIASIASIAIIHRCVTVSLHSRAVLKVYLRPWMALGRAGVRAVSLFCSLVVVGLCCVVLCVVLCCVVLCYV